MLCPAGAAIHATVIHATGTDLRQSRYRDYPTRTRNLPDREIPTEIGARQVYRDKDRDYRLNDAEIAVIRDVGRFRIVDSKDLAKFIYKSPTRGSTG